MKLFSCSHVKNKGNWPNFSNSPSTLNCTLKSGSSTCGLLLITLRVGYTLVKIKNYALSLLLNN